MSDKIRQSFPSKISPIAIPDTGLLIGTPAFIMEIHPPQTEAIDEEPFDSVIFDSNLIEYGNTSKEGRIPFKARSASLPCPTSRLAAGPMRPTSPTE